MIAHLNEEGTERINIPLHVGELKWADWCDFRQKEIEFFEVKSEDDPREAIVKIAEALMVICDIPGSGYSVTSLPYSIDENDAKLIDNGYFLGFGEELSLLRIYAHLVTMVRTYVPEKIDADKFKIKIEGEEYGISQKAAGKLLSLDGVSTGEAIEILEFQRIAKDSVNAKRVEFGNMDFTLGLREVAVLMRKEGEGLPMDRQECDIFLMDRMNVFKDVVTAEVVLTLRFFLINSYLIYQTTQSTRFSSKDYRRRVMSHPAKQKKKGKGRRGLRLK